MTSGGQRYGYTYDSMGNIATFSAPGKGTVTYTYDNQGQLLKAAGDTTYTYYPGTRKIEVQQGQVTVTGTVTPYKVTKWKIERATYSTSSSNTITGWKTVGTYNAGATVTISGHCRAIPVIEQNGAATSISGETRTVTRTVTTYTWNGSTDTKPSGIDVGEKQSNSTTEWQ